MQCGSHQKRLSILHYIHLDYGLLNASPNKFKSVIIEVSLLEAGAWSEFVHDRTASPIVEETSVLENGVL